ncbi:uncharacterized protein LOC131531355 isoform X2 [Onychostoma macrolepis]|nr:uncharacterized protein LOC131531355 isoform X2 [Onychostoma macrolepis]
MEGESVTLNTDLIEIREGDDILWKYGAGKSLIAKINRAYGIFSTSDSPDGRFRDRLKLDNQTGSLTITNITTQHAGHYKVKIRRAITSSKKFSASVYAVTVLLPQTVSHYSPHPPVSLCRIVLICAVATAAGSLLLFVAAVGMYCLCKNCRKRVTTQEEDKTDSELCKPTIQNMVRSFMIELQSVSLTKADLQQWLCRHVAPPSLIALFYLPHTQKKIV